MSLEVAEHVPRDAEAGFVFNLASLASKGVILSWAPLGESSGHQHVNCQSNEYVECVMRNSASTATTRCGVAPSADAGAPRMPLAVQLSDGLHQELFSSGDRRASAAAEQTEPLFWHRYMNLSRSCGYIHDGCDAKYKPPAPPGRPWHRCSRRPKSRPRLQLGAQPRYAPRRRRRARARSHLIATRWREHRRDSKKKHRRNAWATAARRSFRAQSVLTTVDQGCERLNQHAASRV